VKENNPNILFLMETKCKQSRLEYLRVKLGYGGLFVVDSVGRSGGLALFWRDDVQLEIQNFSRRHINSIITQVDGDRVWKLTSFYGHPDWTKRHESWALLRHLQQFHLVPWLVIGDFNEIVSQNEKFGAVMTRETQMGAFREALQDCALTDLGFRGSLYTWTNCREGVDFTKEQLDRAVANRAWCELNQFSEVWVLVARSSDHKPICLRMGGGDERDVVHSKRFKIEASWMIDEDYRHVVDEV
jgi:exonuclease III